MNAIHVKACFVMDCTASMGEWIHQAKTRIVEINKNVTREHPNAYIEMAFVGYRDYDDDDQISVYPFTMPEQIMQCIQKVRAEGGDDEAEDVAGGLERAVHLDWSEADIKLVFHIADAPAHGLAFHRPYVSDRFPSGDPNGNDPRDFVERMSLLDIDYTFVKITDMTDTMIDAFQPCYTKGGSFIVMDLSPQNAKEQSEGFSQAISRAVANSITQHTSSQAPLYC